MHGTRTLKAHHSYDFHLNSANSSANPLAYPRDLEEENEGNNLCLGHARAGDAKPCMSQYCHREREMVGPTLSFVFPAAAPPTSTSLALHRYASSSVLFLWLTGLLADAIARLIPAMSERKTKSYILHTPSQAPPLNLDRLMQMVTKRCAILCTIRALCCKAGVDDERFRLSR